MTNTSPEAGTAFVLTHQQRGQIDAALRSLEWEAIDECQPSPNHRNKVIAHVGRIVNEAIQSERELAAQECERISKCYEGMAQLKNEQGEPDSAAVIRQMAMAAIECSEGVRAPAREWTLCLTTN